MATLIFSLCSTKHEQLILPPCLGLHYIIKKQPEHDTKINNRNFLNCKLISISFAKT